MNHKAKRPRSQRAGCKLCKMHKKNRQAAVKYRDKRQDGRCYTSSTAQSIQIEVDTRG